MDKQTQTSHLQQNAVKCRFFAQYWGTKTMYVGGVGLVEVGNGGWNLKHPDFFLQLKPLSILSDEDYHIIAELYVKPIFRNKENYIDEATQFTIFKVEEIDFLRSKGYAVPFMEYSVDDLISFGWVQLL
jgi:hypothetical protein